ncbi:NAD-dependent succinate-semialdehyde dehydrogenase [Gammaproteobacteria bacterium]|nr:NAD-dependent succinate-semialdehyde dehydrogenase [Gammaproteobacteria bacterium]
MKLSDPSLLKSECYIDGQWLAGKTCIVVDNPADGSVVGEVPRFGTAETQTAIAAAEKALPGWAKRTAKDRASLLKRWFDLIVENQEDLAQLMTAEQGKPLAESRGEITYAASFIEWFAEEARRIYGETIPNATPDRRTVVIKQPVGVCAAITPWNFPSAMITRKAAPALAAGCTMVVKPASQTPLSALALAELADRAGIPAGVFSVITGSAREIGEEMTSNPRVRKVTFTGSTEVGRTLLRQCASTVKRTSMELGGNAPFLVFDDADIDAAVEGAMLCKFRNAGQTCVCANRIYIQDGVYDEFAEKLAKRVQQLTVGAGDEDGTDVGPMIDDAAVVKVGEHLDDAISGGARVLAGGKAHERGGRFYEPTVIADVSPTMQICREETFGPLAPLIRFSDEAEAIRYANDTEFGLAAYFYSRDIGRVWRVAEAIESGMVGINTGIISAAEAPFGGVKQSGIGREGAHHGIDEFLEVKNLCFAGL